jgi:AhpD family alkylhydroperoxidase
MTPFVAGRVMKEFTTLVEENVMAEGPPDFYLGLRKMHPQYFHALEAMGQAARECGPLDTKTLHLIQLAAAAAIRSEGAVHSHVRRARDVGASTEEIHHALLALICTIGFPNVSAAMSWCDDLPSGPKT